MPRGTLFPSVPAIPWSLLWLAGLLIAFGARPASAAGQVIVLRDAADNTYRLHRPDADDAQGKDRYRIDGPGFDCEARPRMDFGPLGVIVAFLCIEQEGRRRIVRSISHAPAADEWSFIESVSIDGELWLLRRVPLRR